MTNLNNHQKHLMTALPMIRMMKMLIIFLKKQRVYFYEWPKKFAYQPCRPIWFGIPNTTPKLSKVLISGLSFRHRSLSQSHKSDVLSYSECKIVTIFWSFAPGTHWEGLPAPPLPPDSPAAQRFFSLLRSSKNRHPQKIAGYSTDQAQTSDTKSTTYWEKISCGLVMSAEKLGKS